MSSRHADDITRLQSEERALVSALAEFDHEARRARDQLERSGGRSFALEARLQQLEENLTVTRRDLERVRASIDALRSVGARVRKKEGPA